MGLWISGLILERINTYTNGDTVKNATREMLYINKLVPNVKDKQRPETGITGKTMQKPRKEDFQVYELASADPDYKEHNGIVYNNFMYQEALRKHKTLVKGGDLSGVSGLFKFFRYLNVMAAGMCYEYVYRVESDVWYIPLAIAISITAFVIADCLPNDR